MPFVERLVVDRLRIVDRAEMETSEGFNIIAGPNGQGKTTLLEAVYLVATGRILRGGRAAFAIQEGAEESRVSATLAETGTELAVRLRAGVRQEATLNGNRLKRPSDLLGRLPAVSFSAVDLEIVRGDPASRRAFLDEELSQLYPRYLGELATYKRALTQRNALLRQAREDHVPDEAFEAYEQKLAPAGETLREFRRNYVEALLPRATSAHSYLGGGEELGLEIEQRTDPITPESLARMRGAEIARGSTLVGPHRDDLIIHVAGRDARHHGSQGQQRTAVIALKLAVQETAGEIFGAPPVLLLDDVFSDLDETRRERLVARAQEEGGQVFLTCTEARQAGDALASQARVFSVSSGKVEAA